MTRELRQRHRRAVLFLAVVLPATFAAALLARRAVPASGGPVSEPARTVQSPPRAGAETGAPAAKP